MEELEEGKRKKGSGGEKGEGKEERKEGERQMVGRRGGEGKDG